MVGLRDNLMLILHTPFFAPGNTGHIPGSSSATDEVDTARGYAGSSRYSGRPDTRVIMLYPVIFKVGKTVFTFHEVIIRIIPDVHLTITIFRAIIIL